MAAPLGRDAWWDESWNPVGGCLPVSPGCTNCYAAQGAGTKKYPYAGYSGVHDGVTVKRGKRRIFNGKIKEVPELHPQWAWPLKWKGAKHPKLGPGKPSLIFVGDMSDLFYKRPDPIITRVCATLAASNHIGQLLTKRPERMAEFFTALDPRTVRRWLPKLWLGFSAENQQWFDKRWPHMRPLAGAGWRVFVSIAPMIGPVTLPADFLALGPRVWCIVAGEQGRHADCRDMDPQWVRSIRDQCKAVDISLFVKQMAKGAAIPLDLQIRQFPSV
jgi:protein gp37